MFEDDSCRLGTCRQIGQMSTDGGGGGDVDARPVPGPARLLPPRRAGGWLVVARPGRTAP